MVVGGQSAGKSTVLEALIGYEILPKGQGIQTRCPIRVCLHKIRDNDEYAVCPDISGERVSIKEVKENIKTLNNEIAKVSYITRNPITVHIYSQSVINVTLVDTPGLTQIQLENQPEDIVQTLESIAREYSSNKNCIILAISQAVVDLANSDALRMAKSVDPELKRTLGVLTKIDMMPKNTNCLETMQNKQFKLKLGFIGVKVVAPIDKDGVVTSFTESFELERRFFENHEVYSTSLGIFGINSLNDKISVVFNECIKSTIPKLEEEIKLKNNNIRAQLLELESVIQPKELKGKKQHPIAIGNNIINSAFEELKSKVSGSSMDLSFEGLEGGAKLRSIFNEYQQSMENLKELDLERLNLDILWLNTNGLEGHDVLMVNLIKINLPHFFDKIQETIMNCLKKIDEVFNQLIQSIQVPQFLTYSQIKDFFIKELYKVANRNMKKTKAKLEFLIQLEKTIINPDDPEIQGINLDKKDIPAAILLLNKYYDLSRRALEKNVPKYIKFYYIEKTRKEAYDVMINKISSGEVGYLLKQDQSKITEYNRLLEEKKEFKVLIAKLEGLSASIA